MKTITSLKIFTLFLLFLLCFKSESKPISHFLNSDDTDSLHYNVFEADNPNIQYTGRIDFTNSKAPRFWTPGVYIKAMFIGTSCEIVINDEEKWGKNHNYLEIAIDDTLLSRIQTTGKTNTIKVAKNLPEGKHTIVICKNTETNIGYLEFIGIRCKGLLPIPAKPTRKIEFIGNSITCGTGSDRSQVECGKGVWHDQHNAYMSYGPVVARKLNAQWHLSSYSGIGLIHSCCGITFTMPEVFDKLYLMPEAPAWNFNRYTPDAVTICLGQNDGIQDSATFCSAYVQFIRKIRGYYPNAQIICLTSPMADAKLTFAMKNYLSGIVIFLNRSGDSNVHKFFFSRSYNSGCDTHPDIEEHQLIAKELESFLREVLNW